LVRLLLEAGADPSPRLHGGCTLEASFGANGVWTSFSINGMPNKDGKGCDALEIAESFGRHDVAAYLKNYGAK
jgi:ankyrin repeat protein